MQAVQERSSELRPDQVVAREVAVGERRRLADIVEQRRHPDDRSLGRRRVHRAQRVVPQVLARDLVLGDAALGGKFGRDVHQQPGLGQHAQPDRRHRCRQQLAELHRDPLAGQVADQPGMCLDPGQRRGLDPELERGCEPHRPDHPERILLEAHAGVADGPQEPPLDVGQTVVRVDQPRRIARSCAPCHGIDREVAPGEVDLDRVAEFDPVRPPEIGVLVVRAEGRDLEVGHRRAGPPPSRIDSRRRHPGTAATTCSGRAFEARSQSAGTRPRTTSRNEPPTT